MKKHLLILFTLFSFLLNSNSYAKPFEGIIFFQKSDGEEVTYYRFYVKENRVRIEDVNEGGLLNGILFIDLEDESMKMASCSAQMYINVPKAPEGDKPRVKIDRTGEVKMIIGRECELWKIVNVHDYSNYEFWVDKGEYTFFNPMLKMLNRNDNIALAWVSSMMGQDYFPFEGIEYSSTGKQLTKLEVIDLKEQDLDKGIFEIPSNYTLFEKNSDQ
jgi:hypothetical protein